MELVENVETASALSQHSETSSNVLTQGSEAYNAASSNLGEDPMLEMSGSEEVDVLSIEAGETEESPLQSPAFEELLDVVTKEVANLKIEWPSVKQKAAKKSKLDECFRRSLPFFPDLHAEVSRSWKTPFSASISSPNVPNYSNIVGLRGNGYEVMPRVEEPLASYLSPNAASSCRTTSALVGKAYMAAGHAGACLHTMGLLQAYQANILRDLRGLAR